jgi:hypothetical protein
MEICKEIEGYEGLYEVSNLGNVYSLPKGDGNGNRRRKLKPDLRGQYYSVTFSYLGSIKRFPIHKLVANAFIPNTYQKSQINHKDLNKLNNVASNLEWVTPSENMKHAYNLGACDNALAKAKLAVNKMRKENNTANMENKMGDRFISLIYKGYRTYVKYHCVYCNNISIARTDNPLLIKSGRCKSNECRQKENNAE